MVTGAVRVLLEMQACVNASDKPMEETPLMEANVVGFCLLSIDLHSVRIVFHVYVMFLRAFLGVLRSLIRLFNFVYIKRYDVNRLMFIA